MIADYSEIDVVQYAAYMGLKVIAVDTGDEKKKLCMDLGASDWVDFKTEGKNLVAAVQKVVHDGHGPHAAICTSSGGAAYQQAMEMIRPSVFLVRAIGLAHDQCTDTERSSLLDCLLMPR